MFLSKAFPSKLPHRLVAGQRHSICGLRVYGGTHSECQLTWRQFKTNAYCMLPGTPSNIRVLWEDNPSQSLSIWSCVFLSHVTQGPRDPGIQGPFEQWMVPTWLPPEAWVLPYHRQDSGGLPSDGGFPPELSDGHWWSYQACAVLWGNPQRSKNFWQLLPWKFHRRWIWNSAWHFESSLKMV